MGSYYKQNLLISMSRSFYNEKQAGRNIHHIRLYDIKYFYLIQIICVQLCIFKYSNLILIILLRVIISKVGDLCRGSPEGSLHRGLKEGATPFPGLLLFTLDPYFIILSFRQGASKYHFFNLLYDWTWDWTLVFRTHTVIWLQVTNNNPL